MDKIDALCDSSSLISLTGSCLDNVLYYLNQRFHLRFIIPPSVEGETVTRPLSSGLKNYSFSAIKIKRAIKDNVIVKVDVNNVQKEASNILSITNNLFFIKSKPLYLVQIGEAEMLALAKFLGVETIIIDERTTRMLIEAPFKLKEHLEQEFGVNIMVNRDNLLKFSDFTKGFQTIRSSELFILAYENGYLDAYDDIKKEALEAALYKIKFSGCSISFDEIRDYLATIK